MRYRSKNCPTILRTALYNKKIAVPHMPIMPHLETMIMDENLIMDSESLNNFPESGAINQAELCLTVKLVLFSFDSTPSNRTLKCYV